jgi:SagB-type dehydrogenase family enzyme
VPITVTTQQLDSILGEGQLSMGAATVPQILVTIARFGRVSWKYSALAYALILKNVGLPMQTFYIMAADMNLGACAIGASDIQMFTKNDRYRIPR